MIHAFLERPTSMCDNKLRLILRPELQVIVGGMGPAGARSPSTRTLSALTLVGSLGSVRLGREMLSQTNPSRRDDSWGLLDVHPR